MILTTNEYEICCLVVRMKQEEDIRIQEVTSATGPRAGAPEDSSPARGDTRLDNIAACVCA